MEGRSVVLSDWTGQRDLADLERRWLDRRRLLAARPAIFTARPRHEMSSAPFREIRWHALNRT